MTTIMINAILMMIIYDNDYDYDYDNETDKNTYDDNDDKKNKNSDDGSDADIEVVVASRVICAVLHSDVLSLNLSLYFPPFPLSF